jgi:hypothetical protein
MKPVIVGSCVVLALAGSAAAGPCASEIDNVSKVLASRDAGSGPTAGSATGTTGQHPPTEIMGRADPGTAASRSAAQSPSQQHPPTAAMTREATGTQPPSSDRSAIQQHPPTATMGQATYGTASSAQDVQRQTEGRPTAAQQAQGQPPGGASGPSHAFAALEQARALDAQGKEADCMQAVGQARQHAIR